MDWEKPEYPQKPINLLQVTDKLYQVMLYRVSCWWTGKRSIRRKPPIYFNSLISFFMWWCTVYHIDGGNQGICRKALSLHKFLNNLSLVTWICIKYTLTLEEINNFRPFSHGPHHRIIGVPNENDLSGDKHLLHRDKNLYDSSKDRHVTISEKVCKKCFNFLQEITMKNTTNIYLI